MSVAERTRRAVRDDPSLYDALRSGVLNYSAAARSLDVEGDEESIATAMRRFADELDAPERPDRRVSVRLHRGVALATDALDGEGTLPNAGLAGVELDEAGDAAAIEASGDVDALALEGILGRLRTSDVRVHAAGVADESLVVAVPARSGAEALRVVESALEGS